MRAEQTLDVNASKTLDVINGIDFDLASSVQYMLIPVYQKFPFLTKMIFGIPIGNLIAAFVVLFLFLMLRKFFANIFIGWLMHLAQKTSTQYDNRIISALKKPISFSFVLIGFHLFFLLIFLETGFVKNVLNTLLVFVIFWAIISVAEALKGFIYHATEKFNRDLSNEMANFVLKIIKVIIGSLGLAAMLQVWGINVTALIASLGLGGLAFALAAKDTASNLFGSFALLADKSIRIGEWVKVGGVEGVVEDVGMRTTKIRSFQKSLITVPNQLVANQPIENFSRRGIRRIKMRIGLTYDTASKQLIQIKNDIEKMLQNHQGISQKDSLMVFFDSFGDSSLNIFVYTFANTANWERYLQIREDVHIKIMEIVEKNGSSFAFPSQSIYVESLLDEIKKGNKK